MSAPWDPYRAVDEEIAHHVAECEDLLLARGWEPVAARAEARRRFGDLDRIRQELIDESRRRRRLSSWSGRVLQAASAVRYTARSLRRSPGFTLATIVTLGMGIGTAAAVFAVVDALILRPIPYPEPDRWVAVHQAREEGGHVHGLTAMQYQAVRGADAGILRDWVAFATATIVRTDGEAAALAVTAVSPGAERTLGIPLLMGRGFTEEDARPGVPPVAILTRRYWEQTGADPDVLGTEIRLESGPVVVIGVLGDRTRFPLHGDDRDVWLPLRSDLSWADRPATGVEAWARVPAGVPLVVASQVVHTETPVLPVWGVEGSVWSPYLEPLDTHRGNRDTRSALWIVLALAGLIFAIAAANALNLALVRNTIRSSELAIRRAVGGAHLAVVRQLGLEGLGLGALSGLVAVGFAWTAVRLLGPMLPSQVSFFSPHAIRVEARTMTAVLALSLAGGLILGVGPGLAALRRESMHRALSGRARGDTRRDRRTRNALVAGQVGLSMILVVFAGLLLTSLARLVSVDPGMEAERLAVAYVLPSPTRYPDAGAKLEFLGRIEEALEAHPSISSASLTTGSGFSTGGDLQAEDRPPPSAQPDLIPFIAVSPAYFRVVGMNVIEGRALETSDGDAGNVVVNEALARFLWSDESPLGRRFRVDEEHEWLTVVGVVPELRLMGRDERLGPYQVIHGRQQDEDGYLGIFHLRTRGDPRALLPLFREVLRGIDPEQWIWKLSTMEEALAEEEDQPRFLAKVMTALCGIALTLAAVGLFGVLSYSVRRRRRELGVRMALGAGRRELRLSILHEGLAVTVVGIVGGTALALAASRIMEGLLYGVSPTDPPTIAAAALLMLAVATASSTLPARRATAVDPVEVLTRD